MGTCDFQVSAQPKPLNRSRWNFARLIRSASLRDVPKMVWISWLGAAPQIGETYTSTFVLFLTLPYFTFFYSCMPLQPKRLNRFARTIAQTTRFAVRKCLLGAALIRNYIKGSKPPENPKFWNRDAKFPPKSIQPNNFSTVRDKCQRSAYTKSGSKDRTVTSVLLRDAN